MNKKNILEICNWLWLGWTEKTMQIFCKYLDKNKFNVFACWIFKWWEREKLIESNVSKLLVANWNIKKIKDFVLKNKISIVHWHSITQNPWVEFNKSIELLHFLKKNNIKIIETSPFSLYNEKIDNLLDIKLFVSKTNLLKYFWKFWRKIKDKNKYSFLYNPLDIEELEKYKLSEKERKELRKKYWIWKDDFVIWMLWRDDLWRWDDNFIYVIKQFWSNKNIKFIFKSLPKFYKNKIIKKWLNNNCIFLDLSIDEKEISEFHQLIDLNLHDTRLWETYWLSIAESIFFNKIVFIPHIDFMNYYIYDRNSWFYEFKQFYNNIIFYNNKIDLYKKISQIIEKYYIDNQLLNYSFNVLDIFNSKKIIKNFENIINWKISNIRIDNFKEEYLVNFRYKENIIFLIFNNLKWLYYFIINKILW